ncbi:MAG: twin-arginine translocase subunit TatC [Gemmatimonadota bacterium]|nr:twin-arginine translocase subunit TatC [Gemmatimonadota bacterium]
MKRLREGLLARVKDNPKAEMPFLDHLEELRWRILWSLLALVLGFAAGFFLVIYFDAMAILLAPGRGVLGEDWLPQALAPNENFFFALKVAIVISIVLASPTLVYQAWRFLSPALEKREKRAIVPSLYLGLVLFIAGVAMAYFIVLPFYLDFMVTFGSDYMTQDWTANHYFSEVIKLLLAIGLVFELPVVILVLSVLGIVTPRFLRTKRRHAIVASTILAALISPGDAITITIFMVAPIFLLYEFSIFLSVLVWRKRYARDAEPSGTTAPEDTVAAPTPYDHGDPARQGEPPDPATPDPDASEAHDADGEE